MAYTPTTWATGDTITAAKLNKLETGVGVINMSYTPYTWQTGDTITAARLNALEQGVADGGSEVSTVSLTIVSVSGQAGCNSDAVYTYNGGLFMLYEHMPVGETLSYDLIVVNESISFEFYTTQPITTYSGAITLGAPSYEDDTYITLATITGNCSVTLAGWE